MTRASFYRAQELDDELTAINKIANIIGSVTDVHSKIRNKTVLCYLSHDEDDRDNNVDVAAGRYNSTTAFIGKYRLGGRIFGKDIPTELVDALMHTLGEYRKKIEKEFDELTDDYKYEN